MGLKVVRFKQKTPKEISAFLKTERKNVVFSPEYGQRHFFLITQIPTAGFKRAGALQLIKLAKEQAQVSNSILSASDATKVTIFVPSKKDLLPVKKAFLEAAPDLKKHIGKKRIEFKVGGYTKEIWAQDLGESVRRKGGGSEFLVGLSADKRLREKILSYRQRFAPHRPGEMGIPVTQIPMLFEGGDITTTTVKGKKLVIVGPHTYSLTRKHYSFDRGYDISQNEMKKILKKSFAADDVLFLRHPGFSPQPKLAFHIDQAVFFPKDGVAVMLSPEAMASKTRTTAELKKALINYRKQLRKAGFKIIELPVPESHMLRYQSYTNAIPITRPDGSKVVIVPSFGNRLLEQKIRRILEKNGMSVKFIRNTTFMHHGNVHCITGTLARSDEIRPARRYLAGLTPKRMAA